MNHQINKTIIKELLAVGINARLEKKQLSEVLTELNEFFAKEKAAAQKYLDAIEYVEQEVKHMVNTKLRVK